MGLEEDNIKITEENKALLAQLEKEQGSVSVYHDKQAKCTANIASLEKELVEAQATLADKEQERQEALAGKKDLEAENLVIRKDIDDVNMSIQKLEQEKTNRDHPIRSLQDELANQDEIINKLNKEKNHVSESAAKSAEDLQSADDKVSHMSSVVKKLESTLDELEGSLEKEKRGRAQVEKERRKVEGDLKIAQEPLVDLERNKRELEATLERKDKDASALMSKLEDEQALVAVDLLALHALDVDDELLAEDLDDLASLLTLEVTADNHDLVILADGQGAHIVLGAELIAEWGAHNLAAQVGWCVEVAGTLLATGAGDIFVKLHFDKPIFNLLDNRNRTQKWDESPC